MSNLQSLRHKSFNAQSGRCYYCGLSMWFTCPSELGLRPRSAKSRRCTAEHLVARKDGGRNISANVVAACWLCNQRRHRRKNPPSAVAYKALVQRRVASKRWWPQPPAPGQKAPS